MLKLEYTDKMNYSGTYDPGTETIYLRKELLKPKWKKLHDGVLDHEMKHHVKYKKYGYVMSTLDDSIFLGSGSGQEALIRFSKEEICKNNSLKFCLREIIMVLAWLSPITIERTKIQYNDGFHVAMFDLALIYLLATVLTDMLIHSYNIII